MVSLEAGTILHKGEYDTPDGRVRFQKYIGRDGLVGARKFFPTGKKEVVAEYPTRLSGLSIYVRRGEDNLVVNSPLKKHPIFQSISLCYDNEGIYFCDAVLYIKKTVDPNGYIVFKVQPESIYLNALNTSLGRGEEVLPKRDEDEICVYKCGDFSVVYSNIFFSGKNLACIKIEEMNYCYGVVFPEELKTGELSSSPLAVLKDFHGSEWSRLLKSVRSQVICYTIKPGVPE